jgi:hypothetical protein
MSNVRNLRHPAEAVQPARSPGDKDSAKPTGISGTRVAVRTAPASTEDDDRSLMAVLDDDWEAAPAAREGVDARIEDHREACPATGRQSVDVEFESMPMSERFDLMTQIADCYLERLGSRDAVPFVAVARRQLMGLVLEPWAGFVLSVVDGYTSIQDILDVSPMLEHETLNALDQLHARGVIKIRSRRGRTL